MPLTALLNGQRVIASAVSGTAIYACCECSDPMHYRRAYKRQDGARVIEHFAHNPTPGEQRRACSLSEGESEEHLNSKQVLLDCAPDHFMWLQNASGDVEIPLGDRRADVLFTLPEGQRIIFEAQFTKIPRRQIALRTKDYHDAGCHVVWCFPEKRHDDHYAWAKNHFYCVGLLSDDGSEVQFSGNLDPVHYQPSLRRPFDPEQVGYDFLPPVNHFHAYAHDNVDPEFDRLVARDEEPPKAKAGEGEIDRWVKVPYPPPQSENGQMIGLARSIGLSYSSPQMREAASAWENGGTLILGAWAARTLRPLTVEKYGKLIELVRWYLNDDTDYSQEVTQ